MDHEAGARRKSFRFSEDREKIAAVRTLSVHAAEIHKYRCSGRSALAEPRGLHNVSRAECSMKRADARSTGHEGGNVRGKEREREREKARFHREKKRKSINSGTFRINRVPIRIIRVISQRLIPRIV